MPSLSMDFFSRLIALSMASPFLTRTCITLFTSSHGPAIAVDQVPSASCSNTGNRTRKNIIEDELTSRKQFYGFLEGQRFPDLAGKRKGSFVDAASSPRLFFRESPRRDTVFLGLRPSLITEKRCPCQRKVIKALATPKRTTRRSSRLFFNTVVRLNRNLVVIDVVVPNQ